MARRRWLFFPMPRHADAHRDREVRGLAMAQALTASSRASAGYFSFSFGYRDDPGFAVQFLFYPKNI
jgi:hypothetical protein